MFFRNNKQSIQSGANGTHHFQASDDISFENTFEREVDSLLKIKDAYPKLLILGKAYGSFQK